MFDEYRTFVGIVAENRGATAGEIDSIARGRVWTGGQS
jgi:ClpP class serine protease